MPLANPCMSIVDSELHFVRDLAARLAPNEVARAGLQGFRPDLKSYRAWVAQSLVLQKEKQRLSKAFADSGVAFAWLKGAALAETIYPAPAMRTMSDLDVLIEKASIPAAHDALANAGYRTPLTGLGSEQIRARQYIRQSGAFQIPIDVHWDLNSAPVLRGRLESSEVISAADDDHNVSLVHALMHACMHRAANPPDQRDRPIWLLDLVLLWHSMTPEERRQLRSLATERSLQGICALALKAATDFWGVELGDSGLSTTANEAATELLRCDTNWRRLLLDLRHLPSLTSRARWLFQVAFPSPEYVAKRAGSVQNPLLLPWHYLRRGVSGTARMFRKRSRP